MTSLLEQVNECRRAMGQPTVDASYLERLRKDNIRREEIKRRDRKYGIDPTRYMDFEEFEERLRLGLLYEPTRRTVIIDNKTGQVVSDYSVIEI